MALICCASCSHSEKGREESDLLMFLRDFQPDALKGEQTVFLLQVGMCGTCTEETMEYLKGFLEEAPENKITFILSSKDQAMEEFLHSAAPGRGVLIPENPMTFSSYGIRFSKDLLVRLTDGRISEWTFLNKTNN